ncbi:MAG: DUF1634 domain-containing protein [Acidimicrobiia bacterium]
MKVLSRREESRQIEARIGLILRTGVIAAAALLTVAEPWIVTQSGEKSTSAVSVGEALRRLPALDPRGLAALGVIILVATPILQLIASAFLFWRKHDRLYLSFTLLVCAIIAAGALFASA